jgi:hypothetical protein
MIRVALKMSIPNSNCNIPNVAAEIAQLNAEALQKLAKYVPPERRAPALALLDWMRANPAFSWGDLFALRRKLGWSRCETTDAVNGLKDAGILVCEVNLFGDPTFGDDPVRLTFHSKFARLAKETV